MSITYGRNITALRLASNLNRLGDGIARSTERLASGLRINHASDDAAGLALSTSLSTSSRVLTQAIRNINDGMSMLAVAEGSLQALQGISTRQLELATQAANGSYSVKQRNALNEEANALVEEWNRIVSTTSFNGLNIFDNGRPSVALQIGDSGSESFSMELGQSLDRTIGTGAFTPSQTLLSVNQIFWRAAGDFNRDGRQDVISYSQLTSSMYVSFGNGDGTFAAGISYNAGQVNVNYSLTAEAADVNGDGALDIISSASLDTNVVVILNNGDGTFRSPVTLEANELMSNIRYVDVTGDGVADIVASGPGVTAELAIFTGNGDGTFKAMVSQQIPVGMTYFDISDINSDGKLDIVGGNQGSGLQIMLGNGNGTFQYQAISTSLSSIYGVKASDFNDDGFVDLAVTDYINPTFINSFHVFLGHGDGTFTPTNSYSISGAFDLVVRDFNNDGIEDLVGSNASASFLQVVLGNSNGTFNAPITAGTGLSYSTIASDFNNDGVLDILGSNNSRVYMAQTTATFNTPTLYLLSQSGARAAMNTVQESINRVSLELSNVGAYQSRLEVALRQTSSLRDEYRDAAQRINDVDVAQEVAALSSKRILQEVIVNLLQSHKLESNLVIRLLEDSGLD